MTPRTERERIERVVENELAELFSLTSGHRELLTYKFTKLLRRELAKRDARVQRIIKAERVEPVSKEDEAYNTAIMHILAALKMKP